jgi:imidazolonepropionase-like amidohydrolase
MNKTFIFQNAFLIDGNGGDPVPDAVLVVADGTIKEIVSGGRRHRFPKGRIIDLRGKTLLPGLIDAHVHPGNVELLLSKTATLPPAVYVHRVTRTLETDIDLGFTTLRDAAGLDLGFRSAIDQGLIRGPRLFLSVTPLTQKERNLNHPDMAPKEPRPRNSLGIRPEVCDGPDEVCEAVRRTLGRGADQIKVFADGEVVSQSESDTAKPGQCKFSLEELKAAVEEARRAGTYVMAHAYSPKAVQNCLEAGVRSIEHGNLMDAETAQIMAEKDAFYVPTLTAYDILGKTGGEGLGRYTMEKLAMVGHKGEEALQMAYGAGVKIGSGSDIIGPFQHMKGRELALKSEVMTPMEAIVSATRTNAELIGLLDRLGTLEPGKLADLIVLDGNPLNDVTLFEHGLRRVLFVMKEGKIMKDMI